MMPIRDVRGRLPLVLMALFGLMASACAAPTPSETPSRPMPVRADDGRVREVTTQTLPLRQAWANGQREPLSRFVQAAWQRTALQGSEVTTRTPETPASTNTDLPREAALRLQSQTERAVQQERRMLPTPRPETRAAEAIQGVSPVTARLSQRDLPEVTRALSHGPSVLNGAALFFNNDFGTNGRACNTCHMGLQHFSIGVDAVQARWDLFGTSDPLFRSVDADTPGGTTYTKLRTTATFNIPFILPPNISVDGCGTPAAPSSELLPDGRCKVWVRRGSPTVRNTALLEPNLMMDAREPSLEAQAPGAVTTHNQPSATSRQFTTAEAANIAAFQRTLFTSHTLRTFAQGGPAPTLPPGNTPAEIRGREFYVDGPRGRCADCHTGPMLNQQSPFNFAPSINPLTGAINLFLSNNGTTERNPNALPEFTFRVREPFDPPGSPRRVVRTHDLGRAMLTGSLCGDSILVCILNPVFDFDDDGDGDLGPIPQGQSTIRTPPLWGTGRNPRFFHDNSARTIDDVFAHYLVFFHQTRDRLLFAGLPDIAARFDVTQGDMDDMKAYFVGHIAFANPSH